jgi:hypothetical protein
MEVRARQVGFMSTQKRENRLSSATKTDRRAFRCRWQLMTGTKRTDSGDLPFPSGITCLFGADANGRTAPLLSILWSIWAWFRPSDEDQLPGTPLRMATNFLHSDRPLRQLVQPAFRADRRGSPPLWVGCRAALGTLASPRSSSRHIPFPSGLVRFHLSLPQFPAGYDRRTERYDGKRDMYFQHAA